MTVCGAAVEPGSAAEIVAGVSAGEGQLSLRTLEALSTVLLGYYLAIGFSNFLVSSVLGTSSGGRRTFTWTTVTGVTGRGAPMGALTGIRLSGYAPGSLDFGGTAGRVSDVATYKIEFLGGSGGNFHPLPIGCVWGSGGRSRPPNLAIPIHIGSVVGLRERRGGSTPL